VLELLREAPGIECIRPEGAFYIFAKIAGMLGKRTPQGKTLATEQDAVDYLLDNGVAVVVGEAYGLSPYFRMSIASPIEELAEACQRMRRAAAALK
jgi:aspartate aminotransferase